MIETHLPDMLRVAVSIKLGKISASAILRRLGTYSRKTNCISPSRNWARWFEPCSC